MPNANNSRNGVKNNMFADVLYGWHHKKRHWQKSVIALNAIKSLITVKL